MQVLLMDHRAGRFVIALVMAAMFGACESGSSSHIECLKSIKESLHDPRNELSSWVFSNSSAMIEICTFRGVDCWHDRDNKILNLILSGMGLRGEFPLGVANCTSLTGLDLSHNHLYGSIPSNISKVVTFLTMLDLSHNTFSGEIPVDVANFSFLNVLNLSNNLLTGQIPPQLGILNRLKTFSVANNLLSGPVPIFVNSTFTAESYADNTGLCGAPLDLCESADHFNVFVVVFCAGWGAAFIVFLFVGIFTPFWEYVIKFINRIVLVAPALELHNSMISRMEKFATRMSFLELKQSTHNFSENNIIATGEMGTIYKVILSNGYCLAIKRLNTAPYIEHEFLTEIVTLGRLRHRNLVPLLGFCHELNDKFLVYKFMPNGSLYDCLFSSQGEAATTMEWPVRAKIAVGVARGIAWLHLNKVVHRRISSECVLLDDDLNPRISDLGRATTLKYNNSSWEVSCNIEFMELGCYEEDVHSFGKVLLELMTGTKYTEIIISFDIDADMFEQISGLLNKAGPAGACVRSMMGRGFDDEISRFLRVAGKCLECDPSNWPSMEQVHQLLVGKRGYDTSLKDEIEVGDIQIIS